jgi:hypothetical protein
MFEIYVSEILELLENKDLLMAPVYHQNERLECWNVEDRSG